MNRQDKKDAKRFEEAWRKECASKLEIYNKVSPGEKYKTVKRTGSLRQWYGVTCLWMVWRWGSIDLYYLTLENTWDGIWFYMLFAYPIALFFLLLFFTLVYHD